ncbi:MAG: lysophospholipid acyltransferase family protein [Pyrinomonadaceae bacterium]
MRSIRAAIKFVLFVAATLGLYSIWFIGALFVPNKQYWRQVGFGAWARSFVWISGMSIDVIGTPPQPPFFLVTNHLSYTDIGALRAVVNGVFVGKSEIRTWFLVGRICRDMGVIFIDRGNRRDIPRAGSEIIDKLNEGEGVIVFPEGTSSKGEKVLPFNSSFLAFAARTDLPVSYATISYRTHDGEPAASDYICWWDEISFIEHIWRLFTLKGFTATLTFGDEPIVNTDRKKLATELRQYINEKFIPII